MVVGEYLVIGRNAQLHVEVELAIDFGSATILRHNTAEIHVPLMDRLTSKPKLAITMHAPLVSMFRDLDVFCYSHFCSS